MIQVIQTAFGIRSTRLGDEISAGIKSTLPQIDDDVSESLGDNVDEDGMDGDDDEGDDDCADFVLDDQDDRTDSFPAVGRVLFYLKEFRDTWTGWNSKASERFLLHQQVKSGRLFFEPKDPAVAQRERMIGRSKDPTLSLDPSFHWMPAVFVWLPFATFGEEETRCVCIFMEL